MASKPDYSNRIQDSVERFGPLDVERPLADNAPSARGATFKHVLSVGATPFELREAARLLNARADEIEKAERR